MSLPKDTFHAILREAGYSLTHARLRVFETLLGSEPLSMRDIIMHTSGVDRASIYRTIDLFERLGIAQRLHTGWKYKIELTDKFAEHHHHLTCTRCGRTVSMNETELEILIETLAAQHGFTATAHQIEIQGLCAVCKGKGPAGDSV